MSLPLSLVGRLPASALRVWIALEHHGLPYHPSPDEIAAFLDVSLRTVYRGLAALRAAGIQPYPDPHVDNDVDNGKDDRNGTKRVTETADGDRNGTKRVTETADGDRNDRASRSEDQTEPCIIKGISPESDRIGSLSQEYQSLYSISQKKEEGKITLDVILELEGDLLAAALNRAPADIIDNILARGKRWGIKLGRWNKRQLAYGLVRAYQACAAQPAAYALATARQMRGVFHAY